MKNIIGLGTIITILLIGYGNTKDDAKGVQIQFERQQSNNAVNPRNAGRDEGSIRRPLTQKEEPYKAIVLPNQEAVADKIRSIFVEEPEKAVAVFRSESGLRAIAKGWNCYYTMESGEKYSAACKPEDREQAFSVDCGTAQINVPGTECPIELLDVEQNIERAYQMYKRRGFQPWVAHNNGNYLAFIKNE